MAEIKVIVESILQHEYQETGKVVRYLDMTPVEAGTLVRQITEKALALEDSADCLAFERARFG